MPFPTDLDKSGGPSKGLKYEGPSIGWVNNYNQNPDPAGISGQVPTTDGAGNLTFQPSGQAPNIFNVKAFGAKGDNVTDDTAAINAAIAAFNANTGGGTLFFPAGNYQVPVGALTTITGTGMVLGDNLGFQGQITSFVFSSSTTATLFNTNSPAIHFRSMGASCVAGTTPTSSVGIVQLSANGFHQFSIIDCVVDGFFVGVDVQEATGSFCLRCNFNDNVSIGLRWRNLVIPDSGGNRIEDTSFGAVNRPTQVGLQWESSGNTLITGCSSFGSSSPNFIANPIFLNNLGTSIVWVNNCTFENYFGGPAIKIANAAHLFLTNIEIGDFQLSAFSAIVFSGVSSKVFIDNISAIRGSGGQAVLDLTGVNTYYMRAIALIGFNPPINSTDQRDGLQIPLTGVNTVTNLLTFTNTAGCRYMVNNSTQTAPTLGQAVVAGDNGGTHAYPVYNDGAGWRYG